MARKRRGDRLKSEMNVVPYIDVMLVLLVIFMISAPLLNQSVEVSLPNLESAQEIKLDEKRRPIIISIDSDENYYIDRADDNTVPVSLAAIESFVTEAITKDNQLPIYIRADKDVEYKKIVKVVDVLSHNNVRAIKLVMSE